MLDWTNTYSETAPFSARSSCGATGLLPGTSIATELGWRPVDALCVGDKVLTFDNGFRAIMSVRRVVLWDGRGTCPAVLRPLRIPAGLLGNSCDVEIMPMQGVMVESDAAEDYRGDPFAVLLPRSIERYGLAEAEFRSAPIEVILLEFEEDEVIYGQCGLHYFAPKAFDLLDVDHCDQNAYKILNGKETLDVLDDLYTAYLSI